MILILFCGLREERESFGPLTHWLASSAQPLPLESWLWREVVHCLTFSLFPHSSWSVGDRSTNTTATLM